MICVTIACGSHTRMMTEHQNLAADGVKLVELRLDFLRRDPDVRRLIASRPTATIITVRKKEDGGLWRDTEEKRLRLLRAAIAEEPEFVDLELDTADKIPPFGKTHRIISYHDVAGVPEDLEALHREMLTKSPFFIKIAVNPRTVEDMFRFIAFIRAKNQEARAQGDCTSGGRGVRVIGICMGEMGKCTRILAKKFGMPYTYSTFSASRVIAPGLLVYSELRDLYHYESTNADTQVFGIIGNPIGHSLSPLVHNKSFEADEINAVYVPFPLDDSNVPGFLQLAPQFDLHGLSVTIPHKVNVMPHLNRMDAAVSKIGACNTIIFKDGELCGYNTDCTAAVTSIELAMGGDVKAELSILEGKTALVLGAGGAGMALAYSLKKRGANVTITDMNGNRAYDLSKELDCDVVDWGARNSQLMDVIVNCTPVGMHPNVDESPLERSSLKAGMTVFDAIYNPETTLLIKWAREKGCRVVSGVEMFVGQACLQYRLFTEGKPSAALMRSLVKKAISVEK